MRGLAAKRLGRHTGYGEWNAGHIFLFSTRLSALPLLMELYR
jgi:hypothetical protein